RQHWHGSSRVRELRLFWHRDLAVDDLLLELVDLRLVGVDLRVRRRIADAVRLQVEGSEPGLELAVRVVLDEVEHGSFDTLERGGQDERLRVRRGALVLVGVNADGELVLLLRRGEETGTRATGGVVDHVGPVVIHALGDDLALGRVIESGECGRRVYVLDLPLDRRGARVNARDVARLELLDQRSVDTADETDILLLGRQSGRDADEVGTLVLGEDQALDVRLLDAAVIDDREVHVGELGRYLRQRSGVCEPDGNDGVVTGRGKQGQPG